MAEHAGAAAGTTVSVVVVSHNSAADLDECLSRIAPAAGEGLRTAVVVVDNASRDDSVARARAARPDVTVVESGRNAGYAAAINLGIAAAQDDGPVLVLNPDAWLAPGSLCPLVDALGRPGVGIAVPRHEAAAGAPVWSLRREPTLRTALGEAVLGGVRAGRHEGWGEMVTVPERYATPGQVDWASGAAMLISRECVRRVGAWDESFLLYSEETDFALRASDAGLATWYEPAALVSHRGGESGDSAFLWSLLLTNRVRLYRKRHSVVPAAAYHLLVLAGELVRAAAGRRRSRAAVRLLTTPSARPTELPA